MLEGGGVGEGEGAEGTVAGGTEGDGAVKKKKGKGKGKKGAAEEGAGGGGDEEAEAASGKGDAADAGVSAGAASAYTAAAVRVAKSTGAKGRKGGKGEPAEEGGGAAAAPAPPPPPAAAALAVDEVGVMRAPASDNSKLYTFGACDKGQCGIGRYESGGVSAPEKLSTISGANAPVFVACGGTHMACLTASGALFTWGDGSSGQLGGGPRLSASSRPWLVPKLRTAKVVAVACGTAHTLAAGEGGEVWAWGKSERGALGLGAELTAAQEPVLLACFRCVTRMFAGPDVSGAVTAGGAAHTWGDLSMGRLGHGDRGADALGVFEPEPVAALAGVRVTEMAFGGSFGLFLAPDIGVYCAGVLGAPAGAYEGSRAALSVPNVVPAFADCGVSSMCAAAAYAAVVADRRIFVWGQLPGGTGWLALLPAPVPVPLFDECSPASVACGADHVIVRSTAGVVYGWGGCESGQLGVKQLGAFDVPRATIAEPEYYVAQVRGGNRSLCRPRVMCLCGGVVVGGGGLPHLGVHCCSRCRARCDCAAVCQEWQSTCWRGRAAAAAAAAAAARGSRAAAASASTGVCPAVCVAAGSCAAAASASTGVCPAVCAAAASASTGVCPAIFSAGSCAAGVRSGAVRASSSSRAHVRRDAPAGAGATSCGASADVGPGIC